MSASLGLVPRLVFGLKSNVKDNLHYLEDGSYVYPAGHTVVIISADGKSHRFIPGSPECEGISAIMLSPNRKLLAVAERAEKAVVSVYDMQTLKRRKQLVAADVGSKEYVSLSFSPDGKLLLAQGGAPDWSLLLWTWEKSKVASSVRSTNLQGSPVVQASVSPGESGLVTVVGTGVLKVFKIAEQTLKPLPLNANRRDTLSFTCQAWVPLSDKGGDGSAAAGDAAKGAAAGSDRERQLLGTVDGEILLFEGTEPKAFFSVDEGPSVEALAAYSKGFVAGLDGGLVVLYDKDEREYYRRTRMFTVMEHPLPVRSLAISSNEEQLALSLQGGPAFTLALNNQELMKADDMNFELLGPGVHTAVVTGLGMCVRQPLIATCSMDRSVHLWNYVDRTCELTKTFTEEAYSIAIHPTGLQVLVGFADKLRLMNVLMDDVKVIKEIPIKGCRDVCFSNGGQYFAAINGITLSIYNTYTCECVCTLRGHNGKVRAMCWASNDSRVVSAAADGAVYEWRLSDMRREKENVLKGCQYSGVAVTPDMKTIIAAGSDRKIKELEDNSGSGTQVTREMETQVLITALALPYGGKILFAATELGAVRCYKYPLTGEFYEVKCHEGPITRLHVSYDDCLLVSAGEDGSVVLMDIRDKELAKVSTRQQQEKLPWSEEVLVSKAELEERRTHVSELEQQVAELTMQTEYQLRLKDLHVQERIKEVTDKFNAELEADRQKFELLLQEKNEQELVYEEKLKQAEVRHSSQLSALDAQYQSKLMAEVERYQQLLQEKEALNERWDEQNALLVESHERVIKDLTEEAEAKLAVEVLTAQSLRQEKDVLLKEASETKQQQEEDADREIEELKDKYEQRLATEREACLRLKGENGIMRKKFQALQKDIEEQREQLTLQHEQQKELYNTIKGLEKDITGLKREIRERDETIGDKERRIYELKKKNQELEKFKFVLDYKIKELKKQIEPREVEINEMRETIRAMDAELERYHKSNAGLDLTIQKLHLKETGLQSEVMAQRGGRSDAQSQVRKLQCDIAELADAISDPKVLRDKVKALFQRHCVDTDGSLNGTVQRTLQHSDWSGNDLGSEYARQRNYLEKTIESLKRKLAADAEAHRTDELRIMSQNVSLIRELNELRREIKSLKSSSPARSTLATRPLHAAGSTGAASSTVSPKPSLTGRLSGTGSRAGGPRPAVAGSTRAPAAHTGSSHGVPASGVAAAKTQQQAAPHQQQPQPQQQQQQADTSLAAEVAMQRELISKLQAQLEGREARVRELEALQPPADALPQADAEAADEAPLGDGDVEPGTEGLEQSAAAAASSGADVKQGTEGEAAAAAGAAAEPEDGLQGDEGPGEAAAAPSSSSEAPAAAAASERALTPSSRQGSTAGRGGAAAVSGGGAPGLGSRSVSMSSSKGRPSSAAGSRRTSAGEQRVLSHAGSGASRPGGSSSNSRGGLGSRPLSGLSKDAAAAAVVEGGEPAPWRVTGDGEADGAAAE